MVIARARPGPVERFAHVLRQGCGSRRVLALVPCLLAPRDRRSAVDRTSGRTLQAGYPAYPASGALAGGIARPLKFLGSGVGHSSQWQLDSTEDVVGVLAEFQRPRTSNFFNRIGQELTLRGHDHSAVGRKYCGAP